ncbi:hypothetical protein ACFQX6_63250 [Streptosporangium lutulentum]
MAKAVLQKIISVSETHPWNIGELAKLAGERIDPALCGMAERLSPEPPSRRSPPSCVSVTTC